MLVPSAVTSMNSRCRDLDPPTSLPSPQVGGGPEGRRDEVAFPRAQGPGVRAAVRARAVLRPVLLRGRTDGANRGDRGGGHLLRAHARPRLHDARPLQQELLQGDLFIFINISFYFFIFLLVN